MTQRSMTRVYMDTNVGESGALLLVKGLPQFILSNWKNKRFFRMENPRKIQSSLKETVDSDQMISIGDNL